MTALAGYCGLVTTAAFALASASRACCTISSVVRGLAGFSSMKRGTGGGANISSVTPAGKITFLGLSCAPTDADKTSKPAINRVGIKVFFMPYFMSKPRRLRTQGFTLIEMMVVVAIVGVLASAAIPFVRYGEHLLKERELRQSLREIRTAIDAYRKAVDEGRIARKADTTGYPPSLAALTEGMPDAKTPDARKIYFMRRIPRDPFAPPEGGEKEVWGLRSYASPPEAPKPGDDVFDVYSLSTGTGSNGVPYRDW
jgi:general secretion pathway protein G